MLRMLSEDGSAIPGAGPWPDEALLVRMHREMLRARMLDERMLSLQREGLIGSYASVLGQEAVPVAVGLALEPEDWIVPARREGVAALVRGYDMRLYIAQCLGRDHHELVRRHLREHAGATSLRQASCSLCVGTQLPHAVGIALALRVEQEPSVVVGLLGDGATSTGDFHQAMSALSVWNVPCVMVCQNNQWALSVPLQRQTACATLAAKAQAYGVHAQRVDGNDAPALYMALRAAVDRARQQQQPSFLECVTYRMGRDAVGDEPAEVRPDDEMEQWRGRDPIARLQHLLMSRGLVDEPSIERLRAAISRELDEGIAFVKQHGPAAVESLMAHVYGTETWHLHEQRAQVIAAPRASSSERQQDGEQEL